MREIGTGNIIKYGVNNQMCGICGTAGYEGEHLLNNMCSAMQHRGFDTVGRSIYFIVYCRYLCWVRV